MEKIISATPYEIILLRRHIDKASNKNYTLYIPLNSIIYIKKNYKIILSNILSKNFFNNK